MNEIELTINGKKLKFTFGLGFLGEVLENNDISIDDLLVKIDRNPFKWIPTIMYASTKYSYSLEGKELDFTLQDMFKWTDQEGGLTDKNLTVVKFIEAFRASLFKNVPEDDSKASKKKVVKK